jgi:hypothetical protein
MYSIAFYENGRYLTQLGGLVDTLTEALEQTRRFAASLDAKELDAFFGFGFFRNDTPCAIVVLDRWGMPIQKVEED